MNGALVRLCAAVRDDAQVRDTLLQAEIHGWLKGFCWGLGVVVLIWMLT